MHGSFCRWALLGSLALLSACKGWQFPLSAGQSIIRCYSRVGASDEELKQALQAVWDKFPENRVDSATIERIRSMTRTRNLNNVPAVPSGPVTPADVAAFFHTVRTYSYEGKPIVEESWMLKTANDLAVCYIDVANCGFNCDVCLTAGMFLPPVRPGMNNEYSVKERAQLQTWFEQDILLKVADKVRAARQRKAASK